MNTDNTEIESAETPENETPAAVAEPVAPAIDIRRRLRELLSIPERDRSDEEWDEIIELEIQLAPGNRISGNEPPAGMPRQGQGQGRQGGAAAGPGGQPKKQHRPRTKNNRRPRQPGGKPNPGGGAQG